MCFIWREKHLTHLQLIISALIAQIYFIQQWGGFSFHLFKGYINGEAQTFLLKRESIQVIMSFIWRYSEEL